MGKVISSSLFTTRRGIDDDAVLHKAFVEDWILITNDKDFGEKVYRERRPHKGVVLLRLDDERAASKINTLQQLLERYSDRLAGNFVVVTESRVRFARG
jgi:predicted nuclease of predicted toxin-antitoxin system